MRVAGDEGSGPVVVLLHGQPGDGGEMGLLRIALRHKGFRVLTLDRPGYYPGSTPTGYAGNATALQELLDRLRIGSATLVGVSWAGGAALAFGLAHPERVDAMLLVSSVGGPGSVTRTDRLMALPGLDRVAAEAVARLARLLELSSGSRFDPATRAMTRAAAKRWRHGLAWRAYEAEQRVLVRETAPLWDALAPQPYPVTVVQGRRDQFVPVRAGRLLAGRLQADYREVDAGHVLHLELPQLLAAEIAALHRRP